MKRVFGGVCFLALACFWPAAFLGAPPPGSTPEQGTLNRVISVRATSAERETVVTVKGNGRIPEYLDQTFEDPPRIVVDLLCASEGFETQSMALDGEIIEGVRIGHHPDRIRIVLDLRGLPMPAFSIGREKDSLRIAVLHDPLPMGEHRERAFPPPPEKAAEALADAGTEETSAEVSLSAAPPPSDLEELLDISSPGGQADALLFQEGIRAFREERWMEAGESFAALLEMHPSGRYEEKASFLLAKSYERLKESSLSTHFSSMRGHYEDFLARFPASKHAPEALTAIGRLCFQIGYHTEAMGYYGLAFSRDKNSPAAAEALEGQMKIHVLKKRFDEALAIGRYILDHYPGSPNVEDVRLETARILHALNRFQESLNVLSILQSQEGVRSAYVRPEISLFLGYNGYQLGNFPMARENLYRFCNVAPRSDQIPIVLTKIGDAYRDEKDPEAAGKLYRLVAESYPETEGALISQIRLAELQEQGQETERERGLGFGAEPGEKIQSPREVYETMLQNAGPKDARNPLVALALLKLGVIYQEEGDYAKSLAMVKQLMDRFPGPQLQQETDHVLHKALEGMVAGSVDARDYERAAGLFYEEKDLFFKLESPDLYMAMARVFLNIGLQDDAIALFKKAGPLLLDDEKPPDLLFFLALDLYRKKRPDEALDKLRASIKSGAGSKAGAVSDAYRLTARILAEKGQSAKALEALAAALKSVSDPCLHFEILTETALVQAEGGMHEAAMKTAQKAGGLSAECKASSPCVHETLAGVFSRLGRPDKAEVILEEAAGKERMEKGRARIQWKLAQSYESQGRGEDSLSLYQDLANLGDPLWKGLAREKIEEIRFRQEMDSLKKK